METAVWNLVCDDVRPEELPALSAKLDAAGLFPVPGESSERFLDRLKQLRRELEALQRGSSDLLALIADASPVSGALRDRAAELTRETFRFHAEWVPAWYSSRQTGFLSAGIVLEVDRKVPLLFLHSAFSRCARRMGYDAAETMAHELVHAVRTAFPPSVYEEYFACRMSCSAFRRCVGSLFRRWYLALFFFGGFAATPILAAAEIPFWPMPLLLPLLVVLRESLLRRRLCRAAAARRRAGLEPLPVLLRLSDCEIAETAGESPEKIRKKAAVSFRWRLFQERFPLTDG